MRNIDILQSQIRTCNYCATLNAVPAAPGERSRREAAPAEEKDWEDEVADYANSVLEQLWGGQCGGDGQCADVIAHCHKDDDGVVPSLVGECRMEWWFLLILAIVAVLLISAIVSCICCPCCFLYSCCQSLCCCCCNGGYSMASRG